MTPLKLSVEPPIPVSRRSSGVGRPRNVNTQQAIMNEEEEEAKATFLSTLSLSSSSSDDDAQQKTITTTRRRSICYEGCGRPSTVCICPFLPPEPIPTSTEIILLHHPHALRHNTLSTVPPLRSSLRNLHLVSGRKLRLGSQPLLDSLFHHPQPLRTLFLFPSLPSSTAIHLSGCRAAHQQAVHHPILIVFDATWSQAREMVAASLPFLSEFATHVTIGDSVEEDVEGPSSFESELAVKKEPVKGCVSTMEAVARALRELEVNEEFGVAVEERLLGILKAMVGFQMQYLKPVKPRVKMRKKKEMRRQQQSAVEGGGTYRDSD